MGIEKRENNVRDLIAFWIFGLANNFAYVIMLSAADDIIKSQHKHNPQHNNKTNISNKCIENIGNPRCEKYMSTGAVLLADILPAMVIKYTMPFFMNRIPFGFRHLLVCLLQASSYLVVAFSPNIQISLFGVVLAALGSGLGEICYLALSSHYSKSTIASWSSGTGGAGISGALAYAILTNPKDQYKIFNTTINEVDSIRDLGIIIDNKLKFQEHVQKIIRAAYIKMNFVFKIIKSKSIKTWLTIYKSYIRPLLEYSPETWNPQLKSDIIKLEKCQKFFTKILLRKCSLPYIPYLQRLEFLNLPTLENRRKTYDLVLAHKILHGYTHLKSDDLFKVSNRKNCYLLSKNQTSKSSNSFVNRVTKMWNVLNDELRTTKITLSFKNKIKAILIQ